MSDNLEKKNFQNIKSQNEDFLDWNDYDEEYEEDDKLEELNQEQKASNEKE